MNEEPMPGQPIVEVVLPTYIMNPAEDEKFYQSQVKAIAERILKEELEGKEYEENEAKLWSITICDRVREHVKEECNIPRYKVVVQVSLGQMKDQGVRVASRCLWDTNTDNYASVSYKNHTLWCSCMVFGIYTE
uniref:Dynein light chain n=1 Tax=Fibrocapsa japonica TaxID=94617 RepID=A0A7S2V6C1_9STRA|mmetsp:Transcript_664/g.966  ORF Transcript_664/g.966 Transcript_664/m.966 type:complete len:134 (+) Transcript_664:70-471(+)|eukprot:CAMPEP_0113944906 /NCGR_PEP_ID=MMETSP1339-20121228/37708_1 /TAXON_ID=94617 /ORGANISM="Fibrocapsa japonica" /LENGTH=133 /DNA_ID=CAMNT_0000950263 /DNA_START=69 /DNA_END=470 /DNA_ORIENTATION=+ /assembly_acc=CAM_ASM_000762